MLKCCYYYGAYSMLIRAWLVIVFRLRHVRLLPVQMDQISDSEWKQLITKCVEVKERAHCPYSKYPVGAAILVETSDAKERTRKMYQGCNVENCAYPLCTCAERVAITKAVTEGMKAGDKLIAVAVATNGDAFGSPCGGCRQVIAEFGYSNNCMVLSVNGNNKVSPGIGIRELLPNAFTPENLQKE